MKYTFLDLKKSPFKTALFAFLSVGVIMAFLIIYYQERLGSVSYDYFAAEKLKNVSKELKNNFVKYATSEKDDVFFLYGYNDETERIASLVQELYDFQEKYNPGRLLLEIGLIEHENRLKKLVTGFENNFKQIVIAEKNIGSNDFGIIQNLNDASVSLEVYEVLVDGDLKAELQKLVDLTELYQENYENQHQNEYIQLSSKIITGLKPPKGKKISKIEADLIKVLKNHKTRFLSLRKAKLQIGRNLSEGLKAKCTEELSEIIQISSDFFNLKSADFNENFRSSRRIIYLYLILIQIFSIIIGYWIYIKIKRRTKSINTLLLKVEKGELANFKKTKKAIESIKIIERIVENLNEKNKHIHKLIKGNTKFQYKNYSEKDTLAESLMQLNQKIIEIQQEQKNQLKLRHEEKWMKIAIADLNQALRINLGNYQKLAREVSLKIVKYLDIQICGFYVIDPDEETPVYNLAFAYAYGEKKAFTKTAKPGVGLLGVAIDDKTSLYYDNLPDDYLKIVTGFGQATPKDLYISPMIVGKDVVGIIEVASIKTIEKHHIKFLDEVMPAIATVVKFSVYK